MSAIEQVSAEYEKNIEDYKLVNAMCDGERAVKRLPNIIVNPYSNDTEGEERYQKYLSLACFYAITETTVEQLVGMASSGGIEMEYSNEIEGIANNVKVLFDRSIEEVIKLGRDGILVDYPDTGGLVSIAEKKAAGIKAKLIRFGAESIFNVRTDNDAVVEIRLHSSYLKLSDDGLNYKEKPEIIVLKMVNGEYARELWRDGESLGEIVIKDYLGNSFDHIPFYFIGSSSNDSSHDKIPMLKIANLDKKLMQNSADSEINAHMTSGATFVLGLDNNMDEDTFKAQNGKVNLGVFASLNVGQEGHGEYKQARESDSSRKLAMDKIDIARQIGAKLIVNTSVQNTKTGAKSDLTSSTSKLKQIVENVAKAYTDAFDDVFRFETGKQGTFNIIPNYDFSKETLDSAIVSLYPELVQTGLILPVEARIKLKELGILPEKVNGEKLSNDDALAMMKELSPV